MASSSMQPSTSFDINMQDSSSVVLNAKVLKGLDDALRCHICFDYFTNCMVTKCSHNYCSVCIRRYMNYKSQCPTCFQTAAEPELQNNRLIDEILRIYKKIRETLQLPCESVSKSFPDQSGSSKSVASDDRRKSTKQEKSSIHTENKQQATEVSAADEVSCPVCYKTVPSDRINIHLDNCLKQSEERNQRKCLPKLVYHLLKDNEIKKILKEHGLSTSGNRQVLIRRHKNFITLYNANCDSLEPKPVSDLLLEIERQELEERLNAQQRNTQVNKKSDPSVIEQEHESYIQEHKSQFSALIQDVQDRELGRKPVKDEFCFTQVDVSNITDETGNVIGESTLEIGDDLNSDPVVVKELSESLPEDAYHGDNSVPEEDAFYKELDSDYNKTQLSFRIKKELPVEKIKEDSPSLLDVTMNQDLNADSPSTETKMSINKFHKKKYARRLSTEEKNSQRKK